MISLAVAIRIYKNENSFRLQKDHTFEKPTDYKLRIKMLVVTEDASITDSLNILFFNGYDYFVTIE